MRHERNLCCFACGPNNPIGLHLQFAVDNDWYTTTFTAGPEHQGYDGMLHGGIMSTLMDEVMAQALLCGCGVDGVTARLDIRYRRAAPVGEPLHVRGRITGKKSHAYLGESAVTLADGTPVAEAHAIFFPLAQHK